MLVKVSLGKLAKFRSDLEAGLAGAAGPVDDMFRSMAGRYTKYVRRRFRENARGGGDWPPIKTSTAMARERKTYATTRGNFLKAIGFTAEASAAAIQEMMELPGRGKYLRRMKAARRKVRGRQASIRAGTITASILMDTGELFAALLPGNPGYLFERIPNGFRVGIGGGELHQGPRGKSHATIAQIAGYHNKGHGPLPQRRIIWPPDEQTRIGIRTDIRRCLARLAAQAGMIYRPGEAAAGAGGAGT